jgi:hypothetical protein
VPTCNRLQPALDHIVANMDNPVPAGDEPITTSGSADKPMDVDDDEDEDDQEALQAHIKKMGGDPSKADDVEAKSVKCTDVSLTQSPRCSVDSDARSTKLTRSGLAEIDSVARSSRTPPWSRSMPKNRVTPTSKSRPRRFVDD